MNEDRTLSNRVRRQLVQFKCEITNSSVFPRCSFFKQTKMSSSSGSSSGGRRPHDITSRQGLTGLYNSGVASVERVTRPKGGSGGSVGIKHSGVVVTTNSGDRWLVHKGKGYGDSSQTVVTNAKHMSGAWKSEGSQPAQPGTRVSDYVKAGGQNYNLPFNNCHHGSKRMMNVAKGKR